MTYTPYRSRFLAPLGGMFADAAARRWWVNWRGQMRLPEPARDDAREDQPEPDGGDEDDTLLR